MLIDKYLRSGLTFDPFSQGYSYFTTHQYIEHYFSRYIQSQIS